MSKLFCSRCSVRSRGAAYLKQSLKVVTKMQLSESKEKIFFFFLPRVSILDEGQAERKNKKNLIKITIFQFTI